MREAETRAATPTGIVGDRRDETIGGGFKAETYRAGQLPAIPSPEDPSRQGASINEPLDCDRRGGVMSEPFRPTLLRLFTGTFGQQAKIERDFAALAEDSSIEIVSVHTAMGSAGPSEDRWCNIIVSVVYRKVA